MKERKQKPQYSDDVEAMYAELNAETEGKVRKDKKRALRIAGNVLFAVVMILLVFVLVWIQFAKEKGETPMLFGVGLCYVETGSMEPTLPIGSIILNKKVKDTAALEVGDIVTFYDTQNRRVTHRISQKLNRNNEIIYVTKGDNNNVEDEVLTQDRIIAVMVAKLL